MNRDSNQIYLQYFRLGETSYRDKVRFYEENPQAISMLHFDNKIEVDMDYICCLFEVGRYERFLSRVDPILETIIMENIYTFRNENIFNELLMKKAACLYQLNNIDKAQTILKQLLKIDPQHSVAIRLYSICKRKQPNDIVTTIKAFAMASILLIIGITIAKILMIEPFFNQYLAPFILLRNSLIGFVIVSFIAIEIYYVVHIRRETGHFTNRWLNKWLIK
jgi:tetratricopeptide (TPR) repeat protein